MSHIARVRPAVVALIVTVMVAGISVPASADPPGAPGPDPELFTPPFELAHPVEGEPWFSNTFGAIRDGGGRLHHGVDIGAPTETPVLAAAPGVISRISTGDTAGLLVEIRHADRWRTRYLHLNDMAPPEPEAPPEEALPEGGDAGSAAEGPTEEEPNAELGSADDGSAAEKPARADEQAKIDPTEDPAPEEADSTAVIGWGIPEGIEVGVEVATGDVIGYVGYSGNASIDAPHLHFELRMPDSTPVNPYPFLTGKADVTTLYVVPDITDEPLSRSMNVVGHVDPGDGFISAVSAYADVAYLGTYGNDGACPATGVRRYDVADPEAPIELEPISDGHPGTWTPAIWVGRVSISSFAGTLAVVAHRACETDSTDAFSGLALYDVTDPASPVALGVYDAGPGTSGIGDLEVWIEDERALVVALVPNSYVDHAGAIGDVRIVDITDPNAPVDVADWDFRRDAGGEIALDGRDVRELRAEGIALDTKDRRAFVAQWDGGVAVLDLSAPHRPEMMGWHILNEHGEGNAASIAFDANRQLVAVFYKDIDPLVDEKGLSDWGFTALLDVDPQSELSLVSRYSLDDADPDGEGRIPLDGIYTPVQGMIFREQLYAAWASGGLRVVDLQDPERPFEVASFTPPTRVDPQRQLSAPNGNIAMPFVWSVHIANGDIYVADLNTGLWIVRLIEPPPGLE